MGIAPQGATKMMGFFGKGTQYSIKFNISSLVKRERGSNMAFPIYRDNKNTLPPYLYSGILYNSVLLLCIVFSIYTIVVCMNFIRLIFAVSNYINKLKGN